MVGSEPFDVNSGTNILFALDNLRLAVLWPTWKLGKVWVFSGVTILFHQSKNVCLMDRVEIAGVNLVFHLVCEHRSAYGNRIMAIIVHRKCLCGSSSTVTGATSARSHSVAIPASLAFPQTLKSSDRINIVKNMILICTLTFIAKIGSWKP